MNEAGLKCSFSALQTVNPAVSMKPYDVQQVNKQSIITIILGCTFLQNDLSAVSLQAALLFLTAKKNIIL